MRLRGKPGRKKVSYGMFSAALTDGKKKRIYEEYEAYLCAKQQEEEERLKNFKKVKK